MKMKAVQSGWLDSVCCVPQCAGTTTTLTMYAKYNNYSNLSGLPMTLTLENSLK